MLAPDPGSDPEVDSDESTRARRRGLPRTARDGPLDFAETGILASLATPLAEVGVSVFAVSTFDTDYLLVKQAALDSQVVSYDLSSFFNG